MQELKQRNDESKMTGWFQALRDWRDGATKSKGERAICGGKA